MTREIDKSLEDFFASHRDDPAMASVRRRLQGKISQHAHADAGELIEAYQAIIPIIEQALWSETGDRADALLEQYQTAFQQLEQLVALQGDDSRHRFVIVIPVADRPQHLTSCLDSLHQLCRSFAYGGMDQGRYRKVSVIVADDSKEPPNIDQHREIARQCSELGIDALYFGLDEQIGLMDTLSEPEREALAHMLGNSDRAAFYHKGPSITRNIVYLKLNQIARDAEKTLFYFIDSDQEFQVKIGGAEGDRNIYAVNYLFNLDRIFSQTGATILTGKVVGDPPVSPAVMAGNFLDDVLGFLQQMAEADPAQACGFHGADQQGVDEAAYHDMAALFGFQPSQAHRYPCTLKGEHDHASCFGHFSSKLRRFFYGEHPTRKTYYHHEDLMPGIRPARTVYTGNYIFRPEGLKYFIPFATLKLRMAGPVLGRLVKSELGERFVSANLPMLHKRTVRETGQSEFRPGISRQAEAIDLSGEFERQFYGDVMLFTVEKLVGMGYPGQSLSEETIAGIVQSTQATLREQYDQKRAAILEKLGQVKAVAHDDKHWWNRSAVHAEAVHNFDVFLDNIANNFSDAVHRRIHAPEHQTERLAAIGAAIAGYAKDREAWQEMLASRRHP